MHRMCVVKKIGDGQRLRVGDVVEELMVQIAIQKIDRSYVLPRKR